MENFKVFGIQKHHEWSYQGKTGKNHRLHCVQIKEMFKTSNNEGRKVEVIKVPDSVDIDWLKPGDDISIEFSRYGAFVSIKKMEKENGR